MNEISVRQHSPLGIARRPRSVYERGFHGRIHFGRVERGSHRQALHERYHFH